MKTKKILIIEDEKPMARALELKLKGSGFDAQAVFNGEEALVVIKKEKFDLIILDLVMPNMDGFTLLKKLKENKNKIPLIVASNLSQEEDFKRAKSLGAKDYFVKSETPISGVVDHIKKVLGV